MSENIPLRTAFHGFNRRDVLACIEQLNNNYKSQIVSLEAQLRELQEENAQLRADLNAAAAPNYDTQVHTEAAELEVYRRAERTEREARERAARVCEQTNTALAEVVETVEAATAQMSVLLQSWSDAAENTRAVLLSASEAINAIRPED